MKAPFYKKGFPEIKDKNKGKFTKWAKANGFNVISISFSCDECW